LNPEKSFELPMYVEKMASAFVEFGTSKSKHCKSTYALNVLNFIGRSTFEGRQTRDI